MFCNFVRRKTPAQVCSCDISYIFKKTYFAVLLETAASAFLPEIRQKRSRLASFNVFLSKMPFSSVDIVVGNLNLRLESGSRVFVTSFYHSFRQALSTCYDILNMSIPYLLYSSHNLLRNNLSRVFLIFLQRGSENNKCVVLTLT